MSNTRVKTTVEWKAIPWRKLERKVFKLQKRIYRASERGDVKAVRRLQKTLIKSWSGKCLAVRRVTQDNQGKKTAGIDGLKSLSPKLRLILVESLELGDKAAPTRRVWIPKPGTEEKRPLGIPTIYDRALQALVKIAMEPEWEAKFEPNSYGFRPGRSCQDAIEAIFCATRFENKYVLDADIAKCFDKINHTTLISKIQTYPRLSRQIKAWLKSGVMDGGKLFPTDKGTPQGGVISPLLANIALHGMENRIEQAFPERRVTIDGKRVRIYAPRLIRYADDFVIIHKDLDVILKCQEIVEEWLKNMGLELKPSKTRVTNTFKEHNGNQPGFEFLGFQIRQYPAGKYQTGKKAGTLAPLGFKTIITPSKNSLKRHYKEIETTINELRGASQEALIVKLIPKILGWSRYFSTVCSTKTYKRMDFLIFKKLMSWAKRNHPNKGIRWCIRKYWRSINGDNWVFATQRDKNQKILPKYIGMEKKNHIKVKGEASPYDGNLVYWSTRMGKHPEISQKEATLLKRQKGKCPNCGLYIKDGDLYEIDHIHPKSQGGRNEYKNLQILHKHCHDEKTAKDRKEVCMTSTKPLRSRVS